MVRRVELKLPADVRPGGSYMTMLADGTHINFVAPPDAKPGAAFEVEVPGVCGDGDGALAAEAAAIAAAEMEAERLSVREQDSVDMGGKSQPLRRSRISKS